MHLSTVTVSLVLAATAAQAGPSHSGSGALHNLLKKSGIIGGAAAEEHGAALLKERNEASDIEAQKRGLSSEDFVDDAAAGRRSKPRRLPKHRHDRRETAEEHAMLEARDLETIEEEKRSVEEPVAGMKKRKAFGKDEAHPLTNKARAVAVPVAASNIGNGNNVGLGGVDLSKLNLGGILKERADILAPVNVAGVGTGNNVAVGGVDLSKLHIGTILKERAEQAHKRGDATIPVSITDLLNANHIAVGGISLRERALDNLHKRNILLPINANDLLNGNAVAIGGVNLKERAETETKRGGITVPVNIADVLNSDNIAVGGVSLHERALGFLNKADKRALLIPINVADLLNGNNVGLGGVNVKRDAEHQELTERAVKARDIGDATIPVSISDILTGNNIALGGIAGLKERALEDLEKRNIVLPVDISDILSSNNAFVGGVELKERAILQQGLGDVTLPVNLAHILGGNNVGLGGVALKERAHEFIAKHKRAITVPVNVADVLNGNNVAVGGVTTGGKGLLGGNGLLGTGILKERDLSAREIMMEVGLHDILTRSNEDVLTDAFTKRCLLDAAVPISASNILNANKVAAGGVNAQLGKRSVNPVVTVPVNIKRFLDTVDSHVLEQALARRRIASNSVFE